MNDLILLELASRWETDANDNSPENGSEDAEIKNAVLRGHRECKRECADALRQLVALIGANHKRE